MRVVSAVLVLLVTTAVLSTVAERQREAPAGGNVTRVAGDLPKPGNLTDILSCAGANEVLWTSALKDDPRDPRGHEAKRKAGWYSAVALWVFDVDSSSVIEAVRSAAKRERSTVFALADRC